MFAPIALRYKGYSIPLSGLDKEYAENVLEQPGIFEWIKSAVEETEVIEEDEFDALIK